MIILDIPEHADPRERQTSTG